MASPDVVGPAAVIQGDVEEPVGWPEGEGAGVVVELRLVDLQEDALGLGSAPFGSPDTWNSET